MRNRILFYGSNYDRGLETLLLLWPRIRERYREARLNICYGWKTFVSGNEEKPDLMDWVSYMNKLMKQDGVVHHGRLGKEDLRNVRAASGIWAYPTSFPEINCITALECQRDGLVPVTVDRFALKETVGSGTLVEGRMRDEETWARWLQALFGYMEDKELWQRESEKAKKFARRFSWDIISRKWEEYFK